MTKEANEREVFFFGKKRKLNDEGEFKVGRMTVTVFTELVGGGGSWYATLSAYKGEVTIEGPLARSAASATKKLERRVDSLVGAFRKLYESYDG
jgi:hypothetical protein